MRQYIDKVDEAVLKDIYPINFINDAVLNSEALQKNIVSKNIGSLVQNKNGLCKWTLDSNEIEIAKEKLANSDLLAKAVPT